jgi:phospholipase C
MLSSSPIKHLVVLMLSGRSFDHMLGFMRSENPAIDGLRVQPGCLGQPRAGQPKSGSRGGTEPAALR